MACFQIPGDLALNADETDLVLIGGPEELKQAIEVYLSTFRNHWRYDRKKGVPYLESILGVFDLQLAQAVIAQTLLEIEGVSSVVSVNVSYDDEKRSISVDWQVLSELDALVSGTNAFDVVR